MEYIIDYYFIYLQKKKTFYNKTTMKNARASAKKARSLDNKKKLQVFIRLAKTKVFFLVAKILLYLFREES